MKKILLFILVSFAYYAGAQNFEYQVLFDGIADNREYFNPMAYAQTILGSRWAFEIGVEKDGHRIRGGLSELFEFGTDIDFHKPRLALYYQFKDDRKEFIFGSFPRMGKLNFPLAMLTDTLLYYRPNIEGLFLESKWDWGKQHVFVDWTSRQTDLNRENFLVGFSGEIFHNNVFLENYILLFHNAGPKIDVPGDHIKDYLGFAIQAGVRTTQKTDFTGYLKAGLMESSFRERSVTNGFINAFSLFAEAQGQYKNVGIKSVLSSGGSHKFAFGDRFYRAKNYWRTDLIWNFINLKNIRGRINYSFHVIDWADLDQQQQLSIIYIFGN